MAISRRLRFEILRRDAHTCRYCGAQAPDATLTIDHVVPITLGGSDEPSNLVAACADCNSGKSSIHPGAPLVADVAADALRWRRAIEMASLEFTAERELVDSLVEQWQEAWERWSYEIEVTIPPPPPILTGGAIIDTWYRVMGYLGRHASPLSLSEGILSITARRGYVPDIRDLATCALGVEWAHLGLTGVTIVMGNPTPPPEPARATTRKERRTLQLDDDWRRTVERFLSLGLDVATMGRFIEVAMTRRGVKQPDTFRYFCGCCWNHLSDLQESARRILEDGQV